MGQVGLAKIKAIHKLQKRRHQHNAIQTNHFVSKRLGHTRSAHPAIAFSQNEFGRLPAVILSNILLDKRRHRANILVGPPKVLTFAGVLEGISLSAGGGGWLSYTVFPAFQYASPIMVGASAGVMAVLIFMATYSPDVEVRIIFINVKLRYLGIAFVLLDVIQIPYGNAGGHLAHLGGAALGYFYVRRLDQGVDIGLPFENFTNRVLNLFKKQPNLKTVYKSKSSSNMKKKETSQEIDQNKIDVILDKISKSGYDSLTQKEKDFLFQAGKKK